jgi:hypothetical protein
MNFKFNIDILKNILSYNNIYSLKVPDDEYTEKNICLLMSINNEILIRYLIKLENIYKQNKEYEDKLQVELKYKLYEFLYDVKIVFKNKIIEKLEYQIIYISHNTVTFTLNINNYGKFFVSITDKIYIKNICEPCGFFDDNIDLVELKKYYENNDYTNDLSSEFYIKITSKTGDIDDIIEAILNTPFWNKKMPTMNNYSEISTIYIV